MPYEGQDQQPVSADAYARLESWADRKPALALIGEFSAGKSTLANFLVGGPYLPSRTTATSLPPIWICHGTRPSYWIDADMRPHRYETISQIPPTARMARLFVKANALRDFDLIDLPGISDPNTIAGDVLAAVRLASAVIWCTGATQAWRQTERSAFAAMPPRLRRNGILVVTRADKLRSDLDREKVARRLAAETEGQFRDRVMMATPMAVAARDADGRVRDEARWTASGAARLTETLAGLVADLRAASTARLGRYEVAENFDEGTETAVEAMADSPAAITAPEEDVPVVTEPGVTDVRAPVTPTPNGPPPTAPAAVAGDDPDAWLSADELGPLLLQMARDMGAEPSEAAPPERAELQAPDPEEGPDPASGPELDAIEPPAASGPHPAPTTLAAYYRGRFEQPAPGTAPLPADAPEPDRATPEPDAAKPVMAQALPKPIGDTVAAPATLAETWHRIAAETEVAEEHRPLVEMIGRLVAELDVRQAADD